ncbi:MAG: hypothetical protein JJU05_04175 [Verrucomicrobia bacterium]|nr:hypothetical protein [Verrucomicrobiota bacterium]MCH8525528.1 LamG domain-containing protein [Kiritimatiellia bacterium]
MMNPTKSLLLTLSALLTVCIPLSADTPPTGWDVAAIPAWPSPVHPDAVVTEGTTDIRWMPRPYTYTAVSSVRYIDFENGDDHNDGATKETPWKHHPWDANAAGQAAEARGVHTYVFKGGVTYRGTLLGDESGTPEEPIRLTRDPDWGEGKAILAGSEGIDQGWRLVDADAAREAGLSEEAAGNVWGVELGTDFEPWALWIEDRHGERERKTLARWPNWEREHRYNHFTQWHRVEDADTDGFPRARIQADVLKGHDPDAFRGATIWVDHSNRGSGFTIMGPTPSSAGGYDPETGTLRPELNQPRRRPEVNSPFFLENKAWFLDEPGEWYFDKDSGMLYLWMTDGRDPNQTAVEVARHRITLDLHGARHIEISGLTFMGGNTIDPKKAVDVGGYNAPEPFAVMPAIRLLGDCRSIHIRHIEISHTAGGGIANLVTHADDVVSDIHITDSRFTHLDNDGISLFRGFSWRRTEAQPKARLTDLHIYRNYMYDIGLRGTSPPSAGKAIDITGPEVADIAGNVIRYVAAHGININGGRPLDGWMGTDAPATPLIRIQVRQNRVEEALLYKTDFGNIEFWQTGPAYIYNNISVNPIGYIPHRDIYHKNEAFYFDHGIKGYLFNNIGWSDKLEDASRGIIGDTFYKDVRTHWNMMFQNTSYNFRTHYAHEGAAGNQQQILGNLMISSAPINGFISYWRLQEAEEIAISRNLAAGSYENFYNRWRGDTFRTVDDFREAVADSDNFLANHIGWVTDDMPVHDPDGRDFRPTDDSAAIDRGVKVFVPWSLYGTVGEWYFRLHPRNPNDVLSYDLYPQEFLAAFGIMQLGGAMPDNRLSGGGFTAADYVPGVLEDWIEQGALRFDGVKTLSIPNERLVRDFEFERRNDTIEVAGRDRRTVRMGENSFSIEAVLLWEGEGAGVLAAKTDGKTGYAFGLTGDGRPRIRLQGDGQTADVVGADALSAHTWHHLLAEVDRPNGTVTLYLNGSPMAGEASGPMLPPGVSLDNEADFIVGSDFVGALDFMRVSRGTLTDAKTTIGELMSWQFKGPHLHDFTGRAPVGERRDVGALEHPEASGPRPIRYTPPEGPVEAVVEEEEDAFLDGDDRNIQQTDWATISAPKAVARGERALVQVAFPTETIPNRMTLQMDLHGFIDGERRPGLGQPQPTPVEPGVTIPYGVSVGIPDREGLSRVSVVIYVSPDGTYSNRLHHTEIGIDVIAPE